MPVCRGWSREGSDPPSRPCDEQRNARSRATVGLGEHAARVFSRPRPTRVWRLHQAWDMRRRSGKSTRGFRRFVANSLP